MLQPKDVFRDRRRYYIFFFSFRKHMYRSTLSSEKSRDMRLIMTWQISEIVSRAHEEAHDARILSGSMKLTFSKGKKKKKERNRIFIPTDFFWRDRID